MEHLVNASIEVKDLGIEHHQITDSDVRLTFTYDEGLAVGHEVEIKTDVCSARGLVEMCWIIDEDEYGVVVVFDEREEAFKMRMGEQTLRIIKYRDDQHPELTLDEAAEMWIKENGALFPER